MTSDINEHGTITGAFKQASTDSDHGTTDIPTPGGTGAGASVALTTFSRLKLSFDGSSGPEGLEEFLEKFDLRRSMGWNNQEAFLCLTMALKDEAYKVLSELKMGILPTRHGIPKR